MQSDLIGRYPTYFSDPHTHRVWEKMKMEFVLPSYTLLPKLSVEMTRLVVKMAAASSTNALLICCYALDFLPNPAAAAAFAIGKKSGVIGTYLPT